MNDPIFSADGRMNTKIKRSQNLKRSVVSSSIPQTYLKNSTKEELCFEYINSFIKQFESLYPSRKKLFLVADNEYGVKKFVCSTIRPTELPFPDLDDMLACASFIGNYILYEPLDPPMELPKILFSPTQTLSSYCGDCFDIATVLCSLLIGCGYDAYVVCGYAPKNIALRDRSLTECPNYENSKSSQQIMAENPWISKKNVQSSKDIYVKIQSQDNNKPETNDGESDSYQNNDVYIPQDNTIRNSSYIAEENENKRLAALDPFVLWIPEESEYVGKNMIDGLQRYHAWVMVRPPERKETDIKEVGRVTFLEPSTGKKYFPDNCPYLGIETVWNHKNYWVNMEHTKAVAELDFNLRDSELWEYLFIPDKENTGNEDAHAELEADYNPTSAGGQLLSSFKGVVREFDAPPSWVDPLYLDRKLKLVEYPPSGKRTIQYFRAKADFFARGINGQCLRMRVVKYLDVAQTIVTEIHEWFENRLDKMKKRVRFFINNNHFIEEYHPGSAGEIKQWVEYPGKSIEVDFYVDGRLDRMKRREEIIGERVSEYFEGRYDQMTFRSVQFTTDKAIASSRSLQLTLPGGSLAPELYVLKMTQQYERDHSVPPGTDIAKRSFYVREGKAVFYYSFDQDKMTGKVQTFLFHGSKSQVAGVSDVSLSQEVGIVEDYDSIQEALTLEKDCFASIKKVFEHISYMNEARAKTENDVKLDLSVFDKALDHAQEASSGLPTSGITDNNNNNEKETREKGIDYLAPYLRNRDPNNLTAEEAKEIMHNCLEALNMRLTERANIIHSRLHEENMKLAKEHERFQRAQREGDTSTDEYENLFKEQIFRINILTQRQAQLDEVAQKKVKELNEKLMNNEILVKALNRAH